MGVSENKPSTKTKINDVPQSNIVHIQLFMKRRKLLCKCMCVVLMRRDRSCFWNMVFYKKMAVSVTACYCLAFFGVICAALQQWLKHLNENNNAAGAQTINSILEKFHIPSTRQCVHNWLVHNSYVENISYWFLAYLGTNGTHTLNQNMHP